MIKTLLFGRGQIRRKLWSVRMSQSKKSRSNKLRLAIKIWTALEKKTIRSLQFSSLDSAAKNSKVKLSTKTKGSANWQEWAISWLNFKTVAGRTIFKFNLRVGRVKKTEQKWTSKWVKASQNKLSNLSQIE